MRCKARAVTKVSVLEPTKGFEKLLTRRSFFNSFVLFPSENGQKEFLGEIHASFGQLPSGGDQNLSSKLGFGR